MASASGIEAGKAFVRLSAKDEYTAAMDKLESKLHSVGAAASEVGKNMALIGGGVAAGLFAASKAYAELGDNIAKAATRTGIAAGTLSELSYAASQSGTDLAGLEVGITKLSKAIVAAAGGSSEAQEALGKLGLSAGQLLALKPDEQFKLVADAISRIPNPTERAAQAVALFGKSGAQLLPLMADGARGIEELQEASRKLGVSMSTEDARAAEEFGDRLDDLGKVATAAVFQIGAAAAPAIRQFAVALTGSVTSVVEWIRANRESLTVYGELALKTAAYAVAIGGTVFALGKIVSITGSVIGAITSIGKTITAVTSLGKAATGAAALAAANPITLTIIGVAALVAAAYALKQVSEASAEVNAKKLENHAAEKIAADAETAREATARLVASLQGLEDKKLTPGDATTAQQLINQLSQRYGDLGISIDQATGKLTGLGDATKRLNIIETQREIQRQLNIAREANADQQTNQKKINELVPQTENYRGNVAENIRAAGEVDGLFKVQDDLRQKADTALKKARELREQLKKTGQSDVFKEANKAGGPTDAEDAKAAKKDDTSELQARQKLDALNEQAKQAGMDETQRKIEEVNKRYEEQKKLLQELYAIADKKGDKSAMGALAKEQAASAKQAQADIAKINSEAKTKADKEYADNRQKLTELDKRNAGANDTESQRKITEANDAYKQQIDLIKQLRDEAAKNGNKAAGADLNKEAANAEKQRQETIKKIQSDAAKEQQLNLLKLQEDYYEKIGQTDKANKIKRQIDDAEFEKSLQSLYGSDDKAKSQARQLHKQTADLPEIKTASAGSFNLFGGSGQALQGFGTIQDRIAKAAEETAKQAKAIAKNTQNPAVFK